MDAHVLTCLQQFSTPAVDWSALIVALFGSALVYLVHCPAERF